MQAWQTIRLLVESRAFSVALLFNVGLQDSFPILIHVEIFNGRRSIVSNV